MSKNVLVPKLIAFDSSVLAQMAKDWASSNNFTASRARAAIKYLSQNGLVPLIVANHVHELIGHDNERTAYSRLQFLEALPLAAWINSVKVPRQLGSVLDIYAQEIMILLKSKARSFQELVSKVRANIITCGTGKMLLRNYRETWQEIRSRVLALRRRKQEVASINHANLSDIIDIRHVKLSDFGVGRWRTNADVLRLFEQLKLILCNEIRFRGDTRIESPETVSKQFVDDISRDFLDASQSQTTPVLTLLKHFGVEPWQTGPASTIEDVGYTAMFNKQFSLLCRMLNVCESECRSQIGEQDSPSWILCREIDRTRRSASRVSGSDLEDTLLATFCLYADYTVVDKRTHEYLRQVLQKNNSLRTVCKEVIKVARYSDIIRILGENRT